MMPTANVRSLFDSLLTPNGAHFGVLSRTIANDVLPISLYSTARFPYFRNGVRRHQARSHVRGQRFESAHLHQFQKPLYHMGFLEFRCRSTRC